MEYANIGGVVTPENIVKVTQGATPSQIVILVLMGGLFVCAIVAFVNWIVNIKIGELPKDMKEIKGKLDVLSQQQTRIEGRLWSEKEINDAIAVCILRHQNDCPARKGA